MGLTGLLHLPLYALGILSPAARPEAPELSALLHAGKTSERLSAIQQLAKLPPTPEISESLVDALRDRDAGVVKTVAVLWGKIAAGHNSVYGESIPKAGRKHSEAEVDAARDKWIAWQERLVAGLGWCVDSADPELSKAAARSLALMGEPVRGAFPSGRRCGNGLDIALWAKADHEFSVKTVSRETILRELLKDRDAQVVFGAFKQLYNETNRKWAKLQIPTLATDPRPDCRSMAAHYGSDETAAELIGDPDESVRWSAGWSIQHNPKVIAALMPRFQSETPSFRLGVLFLLERFVHDSYEDVIRLALLDSNSSVRAAGIEIAIERDMPLPEQYVLRNLRDSNPEVRCVTVPALRYLRSELARPLIAKLLMDSNDRVRNATVQYLENNSYVEAIPQLIAAYRRHNDMNEYAISIVVDNLGPAAKEHVRKMLADSAPRIRVVGVLSAASALGDEGVELIMKAASDPDPAVRKAVIDMLSNSTDPRLPALIERLLADRDKDVLLTAIGMADRVKNANVLAALRRLESFDNDEVYLKARDALATMERGVPGNDK